MSRKLALTLTTVLLIGLSGCQLKQRRQVDATGADTFGDPYTSPATALPGDPMQEFLNSQYSTASPLPAWPGVETASPVPMPTTNAPTTPATGPVTSATTPLPQTTAPLRSQPAGSGRLVPLGTIGGGADPTSIAAMQSASAGPQHIALVYPSPEYGVVKLDKVIPQEVSVSQKFKYSLIVTNLTNTTLSHLVVTETLAQGFQLSEARPQPQIAQGQLVWQLDSLGPKSSQRIEIIGTPLNIEALKHCTAITYSVEACSTIQVVQPSLDLARQVPSEVLLCDPIPVEYIVKNTGSGAARDVRIVETLPPELRTETGRQEIVFNVGTLQGGESRTFRAEIRATRTGVFANKATATSSSGIEAISASTVTTVRQPALVIVKNKGSRHYLGRPLNYEITVENRGDGEARDVVLEETLPPGASQVEASAGADIVGSKLVWNLGTIPANTFKTVQVSYRVNSVGTLTTTTTVNAPCSKPASLNTTMTVVGLPAVRLDVVDLGDPVEVGETVTYVITVVNEGSAADQNLRISAYLEEPLDYVSSSGATQASLMGRTITFQQLNSLAPGEKAVWRVVAKAVHPGEVRFKVSLSSDGLSRPVEDTEATFIP